MTTKNEKLIKTVAEYNNSRLNTEDILTGKQFRRLKRQTKRKENKLTK